MGSNSADNTAKFIQNAYLQLFEGVDWYKFNSDELSHLYLKRNIGFALFGVPTENNILGYTYAQAKSICGIYKIICKNHYLKNTNELYIRIIYVCVTFESGEIKCGCLPVFVLKKCENSSCLIFIDHTGRVYADWKSYLENNKLPQCMMFCPTEGKYSGDIYINHEGKEAVEVKLYRQMSPACGIGMKTLKATDRVGAAISMASGLTLAISAIPAAVVAPGIVIAAAVGGIIAAGYSAGRSIHKLVDRSKHQQTISLTNLESRNSWVNATINLLSAGASGAVVGISAVASNSSAIGKVGQIVCNSLKVVNIIGSVTHCVVDIVNLVDQLINKDEITSMDLAQLSATVLFFQMSVIDEQTTSKILQILRATDPNTVSKYRANLNNARQRTILNNLRLKPHNENDYSLVKGIKTIANENEFFAGMLEMDSEAYKINTQYTINEQLAVVTNNAFIDTAEFYPMSVMNRYRMSEMVSLPASSNTTTNWKIATFQLELKLSEIESFCADNASEIDSKAFLENQVFIAFLLEGFSRTTTNSSLDIIINLLDGIPGNIIRKIESKRILQNSEFIPFLLQGFCQRTTNTLLDLVIHLLDAFSVQLYSIQKVHPLINSTVLTLQYVIEYIKRYAELSRVDVSIALHKITTQSLEFKNDIAMSFMTWYKAQMEKFNSVPNIYIDISKKRKVCSECKCCRRRYFKSK